MVNGISCAGLQRFLIAVSCLKLKRHDEGSKLVLRSRKILVASLLCSPGVHFFLFFLGLLLEAQRQEKGYPSN